MCVETFITIGGRMTSVNFNSNYGMYNTHRNETAGSISARHANIPDDEMKTSTSPKDEVCFRGGEDKKKGSTFANVLTFATLSIAVLGGIGYAHKAGWFTKIGDNKFGKFVNDKIGAPCHKGCSWVKGRCINLKDWVMKLFKK